MQPVPLQELVARRDVRQLSAYDVRRLQRAVERMRDALQELRTSAERELLRRTYLVGDAPCLVPWRVVHLCDEVLRDFNPHFKQERSYDK